MNRWPGLPKVLLFLVLTRALLEIPALIGAPRFPGPSWRPYRAKVAEIVCPDPHRFPCVWVRADAEHYLMIAVEGYSRRKAIAFFPLYPLLVRLLALGSPPTNGLVRCFRLELGLHSRRLAPLAASQTGFQ